MRTKIFFPTKTWWSFIHTSFLGICLGLVSCSPYVITMGMPFPGLENMNPEDIQAMEQELAQTEQAINEFINSLSPEEQAEFQRAVAEVEQMMSNMSEEELNQFFESVVSNELANAQEAPSAVTPALPNIPTKEPATIVETTKITREEQLFLTLLTSIVELTDAFVIKMQNVPDIEYQFDRWLKQKKIQTPTSSVTWTSFKGIIEQLKKDLSDLRKQDAKTKKYIYVESILKNDLLYQSLNDLEKQLKNNEPTITVTSFGIEKLNASSKRAIQNIINAFTNVLQITTPELKKIFELYEPEAQKIKEEERQRAERSLAEAAQPRRPATATGTVGSSGYSGGGFGPSGGKYEANDYPYGYGSPSSYGGYQQPQGPSGAGNRSNRGTKPGTSAAGRNEGKEVSNIHLPENKETTEKKAAADTEKRSLSKKETTPEQKSKKAETEYKRPKVICPVDGSKSPEAILSLIQNNLEHIDSIGAESTKLLQDIKTTITSKTEPNPQFTLVTIPGLERHINRIYELVVEYKKLYKEPENVQKLTDLLRKHLIFTNLLPQLANIMNDLDEANDAFLKIIPADKRYAYFGNELKAKNMETKLEEPSTAVQTNFQKHTIGSLQTIHTNLIKIQQQLELKTDKPIEYEESEEEEEILTEAKKSTP